jgi:hypothetical protein
MLTDVPPTEPSTACVSLVTVCVVVLTFLNSLLLVLTVTSSVTYVFTPH